MSTEPTQPASASSHAPVKEGDILASKYRVAKVLGVGGMGVVVAAEHIELGQKVALKFLLKDAATNDELVTRFLREARASVRLKGAHVAKTLDVGRLENGSPYIVMEFLEGHDLHTEIRSKEQRVAIEDAASYIVQAAEGLAEAHSLGIVHRDLKPGNLFLTRGVDGRPLVKVLDFGISKTLDKSFGVDGLSLTRTEMLLGSPLYMSPEQMRSSKNVDERSDLWALGVIAFELLTGRVPFEADSILELCFKVAQESAPNAKEVRPDLPDELCAAVAQMPREGSRRSLRQRRRARAGVRAVRTAARSRHGGARARRARHRQATAAEDPVAHERSRADGRRRGRRTRLRSSRSAGARARAEHAEQPGSRRPRGLGNDAGAHRFEVAQGGRRARRRGRRHRCGRRYARRVAHGSYGGSRGRPCGRRADGARGRPHPGQARTRSRRRGRASRSRSLRRESPRTPAPSPLPRWPALRPRPRR